MKEIDTTETLKVKKEHTAYIVDFMALIRTITKITDTFERFAWKMVSYIPKGYGRIDFVADCYFENSIKASERLKRGISTNVIIKSTKSEIPIDFSLSFLMCGENKTRLIELIFQSMEDEKDEVPDLLQKEEIVISREEVCRKLNSIEILEFETLLPNHEEADTKVIVHAIEYLSSINEKNVLIRSPSGDADIIVLCVSLLYTYKERVFIDNGTGKSRKLIWLGGINLSHEKCKALPGIHAFTGNDYVSPFFKKGKEMLWMVISNG